MEELREELIKSINENGRLDPKTIYLSELLDVKIVDEMRCEPCMQNV